jgi:hypothetical protein
LIYTFSPTCSIKNGKGFFHCKIFQLVAISKFHLGSRPHILFSCFRCLNTS